MNTFFNKAKDFACFRKNSSLCFFFLSIDSGTDGFILLFDTKYISKITIANANSAVLQQLYCSMD